MAGEGFLLFSARKCSPGSRLPGNNSRTPGEYLRKICKNACEGAIEQLFCQQGELKSPKSASRKSRPTYFEIGRD